MSYLKQHGTEGVKATPQRERARADQAKNSAGGYVFTIDPFQRLRRFLILGSEGGSYYASEQKLTKQNLRCVQECLRLDGKRVVDIVTEVSIEGLAPKQDATLYTLAAAASTSVDKDEAGTRGLDVRRYALSKLTAVCRTGTMLFQFVDFAQTMRGWGRAMRNAVGRWYSEQPIDALASQVVKYRQREGWSHGDLLRKAHPKVKAADPVSMTDPSHTRRELFDWIVNPRRKEAQPVDEDSLPQLIRGFIDVQRDGVTAERAAGLIRAHGLPREAVPTELLNDAATWEALLHAGEHGMPMTAMIRNLATMTRAGVIKPMRGAETDYVVSRLGDEDAIKHARIHPYNVLTALYTYASGHGARGTNAWQPVAEIVGALDEAFYLAFKNVVPAGKRTMLALDVSGSMDSAVINPNIPGLTARVASAAMAMVTLATEPYVMTVGFASKAFGASTGRGQGKMPSGYWSVPQGYGGGSRGYLYSNDSLGLAPLTLTPKMKLNDVANYLRTIPMGGTDCALPMLYATDQGLDVDSFVIYTDNETWAGGIHPFQALKEYRAKSGIDAKLIVVAMTPSPFTIADPSDPGMLDVVGMDASAPAVISAFSRGDI